MTGRRPFEARHRMALMRRHLTDDVPVEALPELLRALVTGGMAKNPARRPLGAYAFVRELESVATAAYGADWQDARLNGLVRSDILALAQGQTPNPARS